MASCSGHLHFGVVLSAVLDRLMRTKGSNSGRTDLTPCGWLANDLKADRTKQINKAKEKLLLPRRILKHFWEHTIIQLSLTVYTKTRVQETLVCVIK